MQCTSTYIQLKFNSTHGNGSVHANITNKYSPHHHTTQSNNPQFPQQHARYAPSYYYYYSHTLVVLGPNVEYNVEGFIRLLHRHASGFSSQAL